MDATICIKGYRYMTKYGDGEDCGTRKSGGGFGYGDSGHLDGTGLGLGEGAMKFQRGCGGPLKYGDMHGNGKSFKFQQTAYDT